VFAAASAGLLRHAAGRFAAGFLVGEVKAKRAGKAGRKIKAQRVLPYSRRQVRAFAAAKADGRLSKLRVQKKRLVAFLNATPPGWPDGHPHGEPLKYSGTRLLKWAAAKEKGLPDGEEEEEEGEEVRNFCCISTALRRTCVRH
jgi:hypothetical protein